MESQQRLRDELHSHTSLIHSLRCADTNSSIQMLGRLRQGDYDGALLGTDPVPRSNSQAEKSYPWDETVDESQRQRIRDPTMHSQQVDGFQPSRHDSSAYPMSQQGPVKPGIPYDRSTPSNHPRAMNFGAPSGMPPPTAMVDGGNANVFQPGMHAYQHPDIEFQSRGNSRYQQGDMGFQFSLPSNDSQRHYPGPR